MAIAASNGSPSFEDPPQRPVTTRPVRAKSSPVTSGVMIDWCAYCQTWQGEIPPFDSWAMSHGICASCFEQGRVDDPTAIGTVMPVAIFFRRIRSEARRGFTTAGAAVLEEAETLKIRPLELLVGLLQPALDEIGHLWARGDVTVAAEHRFSAMVQTVATLVLERARKAITNPAQPPEFMLVNADENQHTLGPLVAEAFLLTHGRKGFALIPGLPAPEVLEQVGALHPKTLGISVARLRDLEMVQQVCAGLAGLVPEQRPRVVVGGSAIRLGARPDPALGVTVCTDLRALIVL